MYSTISAGNLGSAGAQFLICPRYSGAGPHRGDQDRVAHDIHPAGHAFLDNDVQGYLAGKVLQSSQLCTRRSHP